MSKGGQALSAVLGPAIPTRGLPRPPPLCCRAPTRLPSAAAPLPAAAAIRPSPGRAAATASAPTRQWLSFPRSHITLTVPLRTITSAALPSPCSWRGTVWLKRRMNSASCGMPQARRRKPAMSASRLSLV